MWHISDHEWADRRCCRHVRFDVRLDELARPRIVRADRHNLTPGYFCP